MTSPTILLVEDDPPLRTLTARALQENGYVVRPAGTAPEMWIAFEGATIDLVLLDIMLPGTSGSSSAARSAAGATCRSSSSAPRAARPIA